MIDVVIVTSKRADYLRRCLAGYVRQAHKDIAVVIADDGSIDETEQVVKEFKNLAPFSITHVWQEKNGFRRPKIMNEAVKACAHDYLFFTDCDCLPAEDILDVHLRHMSRKVFILGGAIKLSRERTDSILKDLTTTRAICQRLSLMISRNCANVGPRLAGKCSFAESERRIFTGPISLYTKTAFWPLTGMTRILLAGATRMETCENGSKGQV